MDQTQQVGPHKYRWVFHAPLLEGPQGEQLGMRLLAEMAEGLALHAQKAGLIHVDDVRALAGDDGRVDIAQLPTQTIRHDPPAMGAQMWDNPGPWVPYDAAQPDAVAQVVPDLNEFSDEQVAAIQAEKEAVDEALRRREVYRARINESDEPHKHGGEQ